MSTHYPTAHQFQSAVFSHTAKDSLPPAEKIDMGAEIRQAALRDWKNDPEVQKLQKLAYALGVGKIIPAIRDIDENDFQGQYLYAGGSRVCHEQSLKPWKLSPRQLATVNYSLRSDRDVILLNESYGDFAATLAHEIGHYINHRLRGLNPFEFGLDPLSSRVTQNMRRVSRFTEDFLKNRDEFYAETWSRFLCGKKNRALFRYLNRPLDRLWMKHPQKTRLLLALAKATSARRAK